MNTLQFLTRLNSMVAFLQLCTSSAISLGLRAYSVTNQLYKVQVLLYFSGPRYCPLQNGFDSTYKLLWE